MLIKKDIFLFIMHFYLISLWRNDHHQVFKGKFSSGATPKLNKEFKSPDSPILQRNSKKVKKSLFAENYDSKNSNSTKNIEKCDFLKENFGDSFNMSRERTPSPKKKIGKDHYNTMSIKKERKIFNKRDDLEQMNGEEEEIVIDQRYMTTIKPKTNNETCGFSSRFVNDYEIIEVF